MFDTDRSIASIRYVRNAGTFHLNVKDEESTWVWSGDDLSKGRTAMLVHAKEHGLTLDDYVLTIPDVHPEGSVVYDSRVFDIDI